MTMKRLVLTDLGRFVVWYEGEGYVTVRQSSDEDDALYEGSMSLIEVVKQYQTEGGTSPFPAPEPTLDSVLADIEAMGWRVDELARRVRDGFPQDWYLLATDEDGDESWTYGDSRLAVAIALRDAIAAAQQPQEGTSHGDQ